MTRQLMAMFICVVALAAIAAGCGSSDESTTVAKADFVKQGSAICKSTQKAILTEFGAFTAKYEKENGKEIGVPQRAEIAETILMPNFTKEVEGLSELGLPEGEEEGAEEMLEAFEKGLEEGEENPDTFVANGAPSFGEGAEKAAGLGLKGCGTLG